MPCWPRCSPAIPIYGFRRRLPVRGVGVDPQIVPARHVEDLTDRIDRTRVRGPDARHHEKRPTALFTIAAHGGFEGVGSHPEAVVHGNHAHVRGGDAGDTSRLADRMVRLLGDIDDAIQEALAEALGAGGHQGAQVRERPARREHAAGALGVPEQRSHPANDRGLDLDEDRGGLAHPDVAVDGARDQVSGSRRRNPTPWNEGEVARARSVERFTDGRAQTLEQRPELLSPLGSRLVEARGQLVGAFDVGRRLGRQRADLLPDEIGAPAEQVA